MSKLTAVILCIATGTVLAASNPQASNEYDVKCEKNGQAGFVEQLQCLNHRGFNLIKITTQSKDTSNTGEPEKLFNKGQLFKLYDFAGRDITPSKKDQAKYFDGYFPVYRFKDGVHAFYGSSEGSTDLCIGAVTGKKMTCPERN